MNRYEFGNILPRDVRKAEWCDEISEFLKMDRESILAAAGKPRTPCLERNKAEMEKFEEVSSRFISASGIELLQKVREGGEHLADIDKSTSWREYIYLCVNGERLSFERMYLYEWLSSMVVGTMLEKKSHVKVFDYGCGTSLFSRILCQEYGDAIRAVCADVNVYSVKFTACRNNIYSKNAKSVLIDDVMGFPEIKNVNVALALNVFEHLPNSVQQIESLVGSLCDGGVLIENYAGSSSERPEKSDTHSAYFNRDRNIDFISSQLKLLAGRLPQKNGLRYEKDSSMRVWYKGDAHSALYRTLKRRLVLMRPRLAVNRLKQKLLKNLDLG